MPLSIPNTVTLELINSSVFKKLEIEVAVLRLDLTDVTISGNKWFKLYYHMQHALRHNAEGLISVGGAHSNHLHALAAAGARCNLPTVGLLRGAPQQTPTVKDLEAFGMQLHWLGYSEYRERYQQAFWDRWLEIYPNYHAVPEGGGGLLGAQGCKIIPSLIQQRLKQIHWQDYDVVYLGVGTGSTLAGIVWGEENKHPVIGVLATPIKFGVAQQVSELLDEIGLSLPDYQLIEGARMGFGQLDDELKAWMQTIENETGLLLDPVYTAKTLYALKQQAEKGAIKKGSRVIFIHTGGLQGRRHFMG